MAGPGGRFRLAAVVDELRVPGIAHRTAGERVGGNQLAVPGRFVVVGELRRPWPRCGANLGAGFVARDPAQRRGVSRPPRKIVAIRRPPRIGPPRVLALRPEESRGGHGWGSTCRYRLAPERYKNTH